MLKGVTDLLVAVMVMGNTSTGTPPVSNEIQNNIVVIEQNVIETETQEKTDSKKSEKPAEDIEEPEKPAEDTGEPEKPAEDTEEPEKPAEDTEEPEKPIEDTEESEKPTEDTEEPEKPAEDTEEPEKPIEDTEESEKPTEDTGEPEKPTEDTEKPELPSQYDYDIASYITKYTTNKSNANRNHNMKLASDAINGVILQPGDSFSYNNVILSKRDKNNDYKEAGVLVNGKLSTGIGGGICQISSTLYEAALYSGMTITERYNHSAKVGYMPAGRDATVSWGGPDLKFKNNLNVPVMIESVMNNGTLKVRFLSKGTPKLGEVKVNVVQENGTYYLTRTIDGIADYTARSRYK